MELTELFFAALDPGTSFAVGLGLSILAGLLLDEDDPIDADKPSTLSTRGSYPSWICGRNLVAPVFSWAGLSEREVRSEDVEGGKGLGGPEQDVFYEPGLHLLTWGACNRLQGILQAGKWIFSGPITSESHPSGTTVDLGKEGAFTIYWGEVDQPINTYLGDASRLGISSRWPYACYIVWNKKRLGPSPNWPDLKYVLERQPSTTLITQSDGWYPDEQTLTGRTFQVDAAVADADEDVGYIQIDDDWSQSIFPEQQVELSGNGLADGTYTVLRVETALNATGNTTGGGISITNPKTRIFLEGGTAGADSNGTIQLYEEQLTSGINIAHGIAEALFEPFPFGAGIDPADKTERWDLDSLEALGLEAESAEWRSSLILKQGETLEDLIGAALLDHSAMLTLDGSGRYTFKTIREPSGTLPNFQAEVYGGALPEVRTDRGRNRTTRVIYSFKEARSRYGKRTIKADNDGDARYAEIAKAEEVTLSTTVRYETAALLANIREPQDLSKHSQLTLQLSREARDLVPGDAITIEGFDQVMRVVDVQVEPDSEVVDVSAIVDAFGVPKSTFVPDDGGGDVDLDPPFQDEFAWVEVPEQLLGAFPQVPAIVVPRIRNSSGVYATTIHLSGDNSTYIIDSTTRGLATGGLLDEALSADGPSFVAQGPEFEEEGPDNGSTLDLSSDLTNWGLGRQLAVIVSTNGVEICFLQKSTLVSGTTRRLDGLARARYDTRKLDHPIGSRVYIFDSDDLELLRDPLIAAGETLYVKSQPESTGGQASLAAIPGYGDTLYGKGAKPVAPDYAYVRAPARNVPAFQTGDDLTLSWAISTGTTSTGAGAQNAGQVIGEPEIPGGVELLFYTAGDSLVGNITVDGNVTEYDLTNAELVSLFGSEPSSFLLRVRHVANGQTSPTTDPLTITRI
jgi:hypothetical protein